MNGDGPAGGDDPFDGDGPPDDDLPNDDESLTVRIDGDGEVTGTHRE